MDSKLNNISANLQVNVNCPECSVILVNSHNLMFCSNKKCTGYMVKYQLPTINLRRITESTLDNLKKARDILDSKESLRGNINV